MPALQRTAEISEQSAVNRDSDTSDRRKERQWSIADSLIPILITAPAPPAHCASPAWWPRRGAQNPIPFRTRPLNPPALRVLRHEGAGEQAAARPAKHRPTTNPVTRENNPSPHNAASPPQKSPPAGWSSPVARQAHNLKVAGSNPAPATKITQVSQYLMGRPRGAAFFIFDAGPHSPHDRAHSLHW